MTTASYEADQSGQNSYPAPIRICAGSPLAKSYAKLLKAEFELFRLRSQEQIHKTETEMLNKALRRVEDAVRLVTNRTECSVVYEHRSTETPGFTENCAQPVQSP